MKTVGMNISKTKNRFSFSLIALLLFATLLFAGCGAATSTSTGTGTGTSSYTDNGDGTMTGSNGLMWQKVDDGVQRKWAAAITYCEGLALAGHSGWRLPTKDELVGVRGQSWIDYLASGLPGVYWSSTTCESNTDQAYEVLGSVYVSPYCQGKASAFSFEHCVRP